TLGTGPGAASPVLAESLGLSTRNVTGVLGEAGLPAGGSCARAIPVCGVGTAPSPPAAPTGLPVTRRAPAAPSPPFAHPTPPPPRSASARDSRMPTTFGIAPVCEVLPSDLETDGLGVCELGTSELGACEVGACGEADVVVGWVRAVCGAAAGEWSVDRYQIS